MKKDKYETAKRTREKIRQQRNNDRIELNSLASIARFRQDTKFIPLPYFGQKPNKQKRKRS